MCCAQQIQSAGNFTVSEIVFKILSFTKYITNPVAVRW